jgi:hypothetical protein
VLVPSINPFLLRATSPGNSFFGRDRLSFFGPEEAAAIIGEGKHLGYDLTRQLQCLPGIGPAHIEETPAQSLMPSRRTRFGYLVGHAHGNREFEFSSVLVNGQEWAGRDCR